MKNYYFLTLFFATYGISGMERGLSVLLDTPTDTNFFYSQEKSSTPQLTSCITEDQKTILYTIRDAEITTIKLSAIEEANRCKIFDAICAAIACGEKSPVPARIVRRGMMIFGTEQYHAAFIRSVSEKNIPLLKGLCSDSYSCMVQLAWRQDSDDYRDALITLENNRAWINQNSLGSSVAKLFDSETLRVRAREINYEARFSFWRKQLPAPLMNSAPDAEENHEQSIHTAPQTPDSPHFPNAENADIPEEYSEKKTPLLMWLDQQIERASRHWKFVSACVAGAWFYWHYSARK